MADLNFSVVYEDDDLLVVSKPQGLPTALGMQISLCELVFNKRPELKAIKGFREGEGGLLNRLDNETGGLVLFAKHHSAFTLFKEQLKKGFVTKIYSAVVEGSPPTRKGLISLPIAHSRKSQRRMVIAGDKQPWRGRPRSAETKWQVKEEKNGFCLLEVEIRQGLRHQIRIHLSSQGLPIVGDKLYNKKPSRTAYPYQLLFCRAVRFPKPSGTCLSIEVPEPFLEIFHQLAG